MREEAQAKYQSYLDQWQDEWEGDQQHQKLKKQVEQALINMQVEEEEYYEENEKPAEGLGGDKEVEGEDDVK